MTEFQPVVVLVGTLYENNIGATSRAMANMGSARLILVAPKCELTYQAQQAAATGQQALQNRTTYKDWDQFFASEKEGVRIALTARSGRLRNVEDLSTQLQKISETYTHIQEANTPIYFIFGPEDAGLSFEDLKKAHFSCSIPTYGDNSSLNLAQATLLTLFIFRQSRLHSVLSQSASPGKEGDLAENFSLPRFEDLLKKWMTALGFDIREDQMSAYTVLRRLMLHSVPTQKELKVLDVVLNQSIRKLNEYQTMRKVLNEDGSLGPLQASDDDRPEPTAH